MRNLKLIGVLSVLGVPAVALGDENRLENMYMEGYIAAISSAAVAPIHSSPISYIKTVSDVNSLNYIYGHPYDVDFGGVSSFLNSSAYTPYEMQSKDKLSLKGFNSKNYIKTWGVPKSASTKFVEVPTTGRFSAEDLVLEGVGEVKKANLYGQEADDYVLPTSIFKQWNIKADLVVEETKPMAIVFNAKVEAYKTYNDNTAGWGDFTHIKKRDDVVMIDYTMKGGIYHDQGALNQCHTRIAINGEVIDSTSTWVHKDGKIRMLKLVDNILPGTHELTGQVWCPSSDYQRISFTALGVVDLETRTAYPATARPEALKKEPRKGSLPEPRSIERIGFSRWTWWDEAPLDLTDVDLLLDEKQAYGLSNMTHTRQLIVEDRFYPKEEGIYQILVETESNSCLATQVRYGKLGCAGVLHPSYYLSLSERGVQLAGGAFHSGKPHRKDLTAVSFDSKDVEFGVPFTLSVRGRVPWKDSFQTRDIYIADIEKRFNPYLAMESGAEIPSAVRITNSLTDATAIQKFRLWIKGPSDNAFRPLQNYDFEDK